MSIKTLLLAGVLSIAAASGVQAGGKPTSGDFHANAVPACATGKCRVLASDGPGNINDGNGRTAALVTGDWHPMLAGDGGPTGAGDNNGRSAALSDGGGEYRVAGGKPTGMDFGH